MATKKKKRTRRVIPSPKAWAKKVKKLQDELGKIEKERLDWHRAYMNAHGRGLDLERRVRQLEKREHELLVDYHDAATGLLEAHSRQNTRSYDSEGVHSFNVQVAITDGAPLNADGSLRESEGEAEDAVS